MKEIGMLTAMHSEHKGLVTVGGSERGRGGCRTSQACKGAAGSTVLEPGARRRGKKLLYPVIINAYVIN